MIFETLRNLIVVNYSLFSFVSICQQTIFDPFFFIGIYQQTILEILPKSTFWNPREIYSEILAKSTKRRASSGRCWVTACCNPRELKGSPLGSLFIGSQDDWLWSVYFHSGHNSCQVILAPSRAGHDPGSRSFRYSLGVPNHPNSLYHSWEKKVPDCPNSPHLQPKQEHNVGWSWHRNVAQGVCTTTLA